MGEEEKVLVIIVGEMSSFKRRGLEDDDGTREEELSRNISGL